MEPPAPDLTTLPTDNSDFSLEAYGFKISLGFHNKVSESILRYAVERGGKRQHENQPLTSSTSSARLRGFTITPFRLGKEAPFVAMARVDKIKYV